jgi:hypothetical protein
VRKSFEATGIILINVEVVLKRFNKQPSGQENNLRITPKGNQSSWKDLHYLLDNAVRDSGGKS